MSEYFTDKPLKHRNSAKIYRSHLIFRAIKLLELFLLASCINGKAYVAQSNIPLKPHRSNLMKTFKLFPLVGILIGSFSSAANALVIDRFNDDSSQKITVGPTTSNFNNPANVTNPDNTNLINAIRTISVTGVTGLSGSRSAYSYIEAGSFIVDNSAGVDSTVTLSYTFNPTDFTVNSSTRIAMTVDSDTTPTVLMSLITSSGTKSMATAQNHSRRWLLLHTVYAFQCGFRRPDPGYRLDHDVQRRR